MSRFQHHRSCGAGIGLRSNHYQHLLASDVGQNCSIIEQLPDDLFDTHGQPVRQPIRDL